MADGMVEAFGPVRASAPLEFLPTARCARMMRVPSAPLLVFL